MKSIKKETLIAAAIVAAVIAGTAFGYSTYTDKENQEIFANKVITLNKIHNQYEISNVTGYKNCIKLNSESTCLKRMESISIHFANEYNKKLLKLITDEYGIDTLENKASGRLTAIGVKKKTLDYILGGANLIFSEVANINIFYDKRSENLEFLKDEYSLKFYESSTPLRKNIQGLAENKDEVVSIGRKFAELGLKTQNEMQYSQVDYAIKEEINELQKNSGDKFLKLGLERIVEEEQEKSWVEKTAEWSKDDYKKENGGEK